MNRFAIKVVVAALWIIVGSKLWAFDEKSVQTRMNQLKNMSAIERDRLNRNAELFRALSPEQKEHYRNLHEKIAEDRRNGGSMADLLDAYTHWLSTLTPAQRDQLQAEKDPGKKQMLVRQLIEERERQEREAIEAQAKEAKERAAANEESAHNEQKQDHRPQLLPNFIPLTKKELDGIMRAIIEDLPPDQRPAEGQPLPPVYRYPEVIKQSVASKKNSEEWPDDDLMKKMEQKLQGRKVGVFRELGRIGQQGREIAASVILREIFVKAREAVYKPTEDERQAIYEELLPFEKRKLETAKLAKSETWQREFLNQKYWEKRSDVSYSQLLECRNNILELFDQLKIVPPEVIRPSFPRPSRKSKPKS